MEKKPNLRKLIDCAQNGDKDAMALLIERIMPLVKKHGKRLGYNDSNADLVLWVIYAVLSYNPRTPLSENYRDNTD